MLPGGFYTKADWVKPLLPCEARIPSHDNVPDFTVYQKVPEYGPSSSLGRITEGKDSHI